MGCLRVSRLSRAGRGSHTHAGIFVSHSFAFPFVVRVKALKHQETVRGIRFDVKLCLHDCCFKIHSIPVHKLIIDTETISTV